MNIPTSTTPGEFIASICKQLGLRVGETEATASAEAQAEATEIALSFYRKVHHTLFQGSSEVGFMESGAEPLITDFMMIGGILWHCAEKLDGDLTRLPESVTELSSFAFIRKLDDEQLELKRNRDVPQSTSPVQI